jgi:hypothetical protein
MNRYTLFASATVLLAVPFLVSCGKSPSTETATATTSSVGQSPSSDAVVRAATNLLDAVIKGDTQRAGACLTPRAMQQIIASGKPFAPPGFKSMTFKPGEVRMPAVDRAFVSFAVIDVSSGNPTSDEVACVMRLVENEWRVAGLAAWGPNQSVTELNFESNQSRPIQTQPTSPNTVGQPTTTPPGAATLPPRMAQEPGTTSPY